MKAKTETTKTKKTHKYLMTIEFETTLPVKTHKNYQIQFENGIPYFAEVTKMNDSLNSSFVYGTGKVKLKKVGQGRTEEE